MARFSDVRMQGFRDRTPARQARRLLLDSVARLDIEQVPVTRCAGRVLAADVAAAADVPGFDRAAMDGYALIAEETFGAGSGTPLPFRIVGESLPGRPQPGRIGSGDAVRIMTGAPLPAGADAVVPAENARETADTVLITAPVPPGKNVGRRGEDVRAGARVLAAGRRLRPQDAALLASVGAGKVTVVRRPQVEIIVTGNELLPPGSLPSGACIVDSNSVMLTALAARDGGQVAEPRRVEDAAEALRAALQAACGDIILLSGGSSVGVEDHAPRVLAAVGRVAVHGVAMRPSSPAGFGFLAARRDPGSSAGAAADATGRPVVLLPGNPVSCLCAYDFFAGPAIRRLGGLPTGWPYVSIRRRLTGKIASQVGRLDYVRVRLADDGVEPLGISGASILSSTVRADGFVIVPEDAEGHASGETITVFLYDAPLPEV